MSAQEENSAGNTGHAAEQSDRAAEKSNEAGSYRSERYPEDPEIRHIAGGQPAGVRAAAKRLGRPVDHGWGPAK